MRFAKIFPIAVILVMILIGFYLYPYLPDLVAIHWGITGDANGYASKAFGLFFMPGLCLFLYLIFLVLPKTRAYSRNFPAFDQYYYLFIVVIFAFLFYLHLLTLFWNLGSRFNLIQLLSPALAVLFLYAGHLCIVSQRNWFVGVRTPWTLRNDVVWHRSNVFAGKFLKIFALVSLFTAFLPQYTLYLIVFPLLAFVPLIFFYSYWISRSH